MGDVRREMPKHDERIRRGNVNIHRDQGIIEQFNQTLGECHFTFQYSQEMNFKEGYTEKVKRLPEGSTIYKRNCLIGNGLIQNIFLSLKKR